MMTNDIIAAKTTDALADLLDTYCTDHALPLISADELILELWAMIDDEDDHVLVSQYRRHIQWLSAFVRRWEAVQADEDFEQAVLVRGE